MRKSYLLLGLAVAVGFNSCSRELSENPDSAIQGQGTHSLKASIEPSQPATRTGLGEKDEDRGSTPLLWSEGDQIAVVDDATPAVVHQYILDASAVGQTDGTFTVAVGDGVKGATSITAYYPYAFFSTKGGLSIPAAQNHKAGRTMETNMLPMYAHATTTDDVAQLTFHPVAGIINLQLKKNDKLSESRTFYSVRLVSTQDNLSGQGSLTDSADGQKQLVVDGEDASKEIVFSLGDDGITLDADQETSMMFVVPARTYAAATLKFVLQYKDAASDENFQTVELPVRSAVEVQRGHIVNFSTTTVGIVESVAPDQVEGKINEWAADPDSQVPDVLEVTGMSEATDYTINLPAVYPAVENTETITLVAPEVAAGATVTVQEVPSTGTAAHQYVSLSNRSENSHDLIVNLPHSSVTIDGAFDNVESLTADQTLIIPSGTTVQNLTLKQGSVKIYGTVVNLTTEAGWTGKIIRGVSSQEDLDRAIAGSANYRADYALIDKPVSGLNGKGATLALPLTLTADASLSDITIRPDETVEANGVTIGADNIAVSLTGVDIFVSSNNVNAALNTGVMMSGVSNVTVDLTDCNIVVPKSYQRGVNMHSAKADGTVTLNLDNTHIGPTLERLSADYTQDTYTSEQVEAFKARVDSRGISFAEHAGNYTVNIKNSVIEGVFYVLNFTYYAAPAEINVDHSVLDGRCAFNVWANGKGVKIDVKNASKLVGRNYFPGPTEVFANIVLESKANGQAAENNVITVRDSEIHCFNDPLTNTNWQYAADLRSEGANTLNLLGNTRIFDHSGRLDYAVDVAYWSNTVNVDETVGFDLGKEGATVLRSNVWDGASFSVPGRSLDGKYYIGLPAQLAVLTQQAVGDMDIVLVRDLDLNNEPWLAKYPTGAAKANNIDGGGHTIYNLNTATTGWDTKTECAGLFSAFSGTLKNLTIENATVYGSRAGALMGRLDFGTVSDCHVKNVTFIGGAQKMAGLIGFVNGTGDVTIENCSVENGKILKDLNPKDDNGDAVTGDASAQMGGLVGFMQSVGDANVTVTGNTIKNVTIESGQMWDDYEQCTSSVFIGNIANVAKWPNSVYTLSGNLVENSTCDAKVNMNPYIGFYYPQGSRIVVDGTVIAEIPASEGDGE